MTKVKRIKRVTVLAKRSQRIRPIAKNKSKRLSLYHKLKVNNHTLARALSQEKQDSQMLFSRNVELLGELQDLAHSCHNRDLVIHNVLKNSKDMMQMLVTMSTFLTNTITTCKEFVSNQALSNQRTSSSPGRRESTKRLSTKSPAKGVVQPMVSGHTITKPTINLSRVNMQRLPNTNLSLIEEASSTPERASTDNRHSRPLPERNPVSAINNPENEVHPIVNRRTSRYSGSRLSAGRRYSKRNSGRLSGKISKRSSECSELIKSPRVNLQDVSRYLSNSRTVNVRLLSETNGSINTDESSNESSSPEPHPNVTLPEQQFSTSSGSDSETTKLKKTNQPLLESHFIDPMEGPSWMHDNSPSEDQENRPPSNGSLNHSQNGETSPLSSFSCERRSRGHSIFRVPDLPKAFGKNNPSRESMNASLNSPTPLGTVVDNTTYSSNRDDNSEDDDDDDDDDEEVGRQRNLRFITQRRGNSSHAASTVAPNDSSLLDDEEDDETLMLNMRRQVKMQSAINEQPEGLQFDLNELLQMTPLKPLLKLNGKTNNSPPAAGNYHEIDEATAPIQLTQRLAPSATEGIDNFAALTSLRLPNTATESAPMVTVRCQEPSRFSELTTQRLSCGIEMPRFTEVLSTSPEYRQSEIIASPLIVKKEMQKRKKTKVKIVEPANTENQENNETEAPLGKRTRQLKKKTKDKEQNTEKEKEKESKDPSRAKVVLRKLNDSKHLNAQPTDNGRKNSDESLASIRSSHPSRGDRSSDSDCSVISQNSVTRSTRPRRLKAPTNLQEPTLNKKLRRA